MRKCQGRPELLKYHNLVANITSDSSEVDNACLSLKNCITNSWDAKQFYDYYNDGEVDADKSVVYVEFSIFNREESLL